MASLFSKRLRSLAAILTCNLGLMTFWSAVHAEEAVIAGSALYRERIALPGDAIFDATLEEFSQADTKAEVIGRVRVESPRQSPIKFSITYNAARIDPSLRYTVRAKIVHRDQVIFVADAVNVLMTDNKTNVVLVLRKALAAGVSRSTADLENTYWKLTRLGQEPVNVAEGQREPYFILQPAKNRVVGFGGCNSVSSTYRLDGNSIAFTQAAGTLIACQKNANAETAFHRALSKARRWSIGGEQLELFDSAGQSLALFESRYQK